MRTRRLLAAAIALGALAAQAELRVEISATDPPSPAALARDEPMRLRIEYAGAEQTSLWVRPYYRGEAVKRAKTNPSRKHTGSGTALGWFSLDAADSVDMFISTGFTAAVVGLFVAGIAGPAWAMWKWRGWWRVLGGLPLVTMAFVIGRILVDTAADPTSHNLWPFEILMVGGAGIVLLAVLAVARKVVQPG